MVEFVNEPVSVEVRLRRDGTTRPLAFVWRGRRFQIESWGRESTETGEGKAVRCHLVQTTGLETWELCQNTETSQWILARHWVTKYRTVA
jgi:hypothetical protein